MAYFPLGYPQSLYLSFLINDCIVVFIIQASLTINPAALLPGAAPARPGAVSLLPGTAPKSSSGVLSSVFPPLGAQTGSEQGVSFDAPVQVTTLPSAHKVRSTFLCAFLLIASISGANLLSRRLVPKSLHSGDPSPEQQGSKQPKYLQQKKMLCCQFLNRLVSSYLQKINQAKLSPQICLLPLCPK